MTRNLRDLLGGEPVRAVTGDGVRLAGLHLPARAGADGELAFVLAHGFTCSVRRPVFQAICGRLAGFGGVVACDFRGHGGSGGRSTLGAEEVWDLRAAVRWARERGYRRVVTVGFSMGGSVVLRHAALYRQVDAAVSVSAPSRWYILDTSPMRRVHWLCETRLGRATARLIGTRIGAAWHRLPACPLELVHQIPPVPLLLVHGDQDAYFTLEHPHALAAAAGATPPGAELWIEPGFGHAESAATPDLIDRIARWSVTHTARERSAEQSRGPAPVAAGRPAVPEAPGAF